MKRFLLRLGCLFGTVILSSLAISSCASGGAPPPNNRMSRLSNTKMTTLNTGYQVYQAHCTRCHKANAPVPPVGRAWHPESLGLSLYESLNAEQRYGVQQYLKAVDKARFQVNTGSLKDTM